MVNRVRDSTLRPEEVVKTGLEVRKDFPALAAARVDELTGKPARVFNLGPIRIKAS